MNIFTLLSDEEEKEYRKWARDNFDASKDDINPVWHPVIQFECQDMIAELGESLADCDGYILRDVR